MQSCASASCSTRSPSFTRVAMVVTNTPCPETVTTLSSVPSRAASSCSSSRCSGFSPDATRLSGGAGAGGGAGAVPLAGLLGGAGDGGVSGEAEVVVARPVDDGPSTDHRGIVGDALVDVEVRILEPECLREAEPLLQLLHFGELVDAPACL